MKILIALVALTSAICMSGCNKQVVDLNYAFNKAYLTIGDEVQEVSIKTWNDYENSDMMQITSEDGTVYLTHSENVVLFKEAATKKMEELDA